MPQLVFSRLATSFFLIVAAASASAQGIVGTVTNAKTHEPVPYVNIGVPGKTIGTVADDKGAYRLNAAAPTDTVRISSIGFRARQLTVRELLAQPNVTLSEDAVALREVKVKAKGLYKRTRTLGITSNSENVTLTLHSKDLGAEMGTVIKLKHRPTKVLNANFNVAYNRVGSLTFRVNLYRLLPNGKPSDVKILTRDIIVTTSVAKGPITIDLTPDQLVLDDDFFLALEWIGGADTKKVNNNLAFSAGIGYANNDLYERPASQFTWERASVGAVLAGMQPQLAFYVTVND